MFLLTLGAGISWRIGAPWPLFVAVALLAILVGPTVLASWRHRDDFAALRRACRRIADAYDKPLVELGGMVGTRPAVLRQVVRARCEAADSDGVTLLIEVAEGDVMERAWLEEGFDAAERVDTTWGRFTLLVRRPLGS